MKTLYLHCGYHKTGSSFLQTMFARNRNLLEKSSIYYPYSDRELDMLQGNISPGNGQELSDSLDSSNSNLTYSIFEKGIVAANKRECDSLLYSNEGLFHVFAKEEALSRLCIAAQNSGFDEIKTLVYFRDPVSHALSTYKHRSKRGDHSDFQEWVANKYETMDLISKFNNYHSEYPIRWSCRKYRSDSDFMAESAFADWLELDIPEIPKDDKVNTSLTLSEIRVLQVLKNNFRETIPFLREAYGNIDKSDKSSDRDLNRVYKSVAFQALIKYRDLIDTINQLLPVGENLIFEGEMNDSMMIHYEELEITLKNKQIEALAIGFIEAEKAKKIVNRVGNFLEKGLNKVKRHLKASGF